MIMIILAAIVLREYVHPNIFLKTLSNLTFWSTCC